MDRPQPEDASGFLTAWAGAQQRWSETIERARGLSEEQLNQNVDGEWSFIQTLRHLVFVADSWVSRGMLGVRAPHHPLGLPPTGMKAVRRAGLWPVRRCTLAVVNEEWRHRDYAERDLAVLVGRGR